MSNDLDVTVKLNASDVLDAVRPIIEKLEDIHRGSLPIYKEADKKRLLSRFLKFLPDAEAARGRSKDRSTKVGAVVLDDDFNLRISGYNGFPRGVNDDIDERHARPIKYDFSAHSEENCISQAARVGVSLKDCTILLTSLFPCTGCSRMIIQSGIKRVIAPVKKDAGNGADTRMDWSEKEKLALEMLAEAGVEVWYY